MEKTIKNIRSEFSTDRNYIEVFDLEIPLKSCAHIAEAMKVARRLKNKDWFAGVALDPWKLGLFLVGGQHDDCYQVTEAIATATHVVVTVTSKYSTEDLCESEAILTEDFMGCGDRFLLRYGDDDKVHKFDPEEDDIADFDLYRANSLEEAEELCRMASNEAGDADQSDYGFGGDFTPEQQNSV